MKLGTADVIRANSRRLPLADNSVDLVVTSPPYFALRSYQDGGEHYAGQIGDEPTPDEFVSSLLEVTAECVRVLKPSGSLWVNLGDKYAGQGSTRSAVGEPGFSSDQYPCDSSLSAQLPQYPSHPSPNSENSSPQSRHFTMSDSVGPLADMRQGARDGNRRSRPAPVQGVRGKSLIGIPWRYALRCIDDLGLILRAEVIWSKPNGLPESVTDRVRRSHETWFHFTLQQRYFSAVDEIREEYDAKTAQRYAAGYGTTRKLSEAQLSKNTDYYVDGLTPNPRGKLPGSVRTVPTEPLYVPDHLGVDHFAAFPTAWPKWIICGWCPDRGTVLDPFGGTGTTAMVAKALGCHGISVDMSADYCRLAEWRTNDRDQLAKVLGVAKAEQQPEDQLSIFDLGEPA